MINGYDIAYATGVAVASPVWLIGAASRRKVLGAFSQRMGKDIPRREHSRPAVMIHAVSLGEVNATRSLMKMLIERRPGIHIILSTTTTAGYERARELHGTSSDVTIVRFPLDFSWAVNRVLDALRPDVVVLMELEVWPNFVRACDRRQIPVLIANGRLTTYSYRRYRAVWPLARAMFKRLTAVYAQDKVYAERFKKLGVPGERVVVAGSLKFDTAQVGDGIIGDEQLAAECGLPVPPINPANPVWVCGSTGPGEEEIIVREYRNLLGRFSRLRLVIVPRKPERFDEVAETIMLANFNVLRRSFTGAGKTPPEFPENPIPPVVLGDTMGELRKFYSLATVVFVGRTLVDLGPRQHGSDMIEPAALAKPVIVGPYTGNFAEPMDRFRKAEAIWECIDGASLGQTVAVLLSTPAEARMMGVRAQEVVLTEQGATDRHVQIILQQLDRRQPVMGAVL